MTGIGGANKLCYRLSFFEDGTAPEDRWMIFPDKGHVVASTYNVVVVLLSQLQCLTFLPLHSRPPSSDKIRVLGIGLVNGDHFVDLKACFPVPPIANNWFKFRWEEANEWETLFSAQIEAFKAIIGSDVATAESINHLQAEICIIFQHLDTESLDGAGWGGSGLLHSNKAQLPIIARPGEGTSREVKGAAHTFTAIGAST
ncbi:uncharacterized protein LOC131328818 [Rhododendron vialii]|uniref:uncharacterized protein LOC131328818 n=1 Tax=Rhododendron vialii TaxID=182163 RepID=UPI00265F3330|nr:uncharacterized protein LOC131328818 [Rhododendron vialii]